MTKPQRIIAWTTALSAVLWAAILWAAAVMFKEAGVKVVKA
jgi:hypothetical protein